MSDINEYERVLVKAFGRTVLLDEGVEVVFCIRKIDGVPHLESIEPEKMRISQDQCLMAWDYYKTIGPFVPHSMAFLSISDVCRVTQKCRQTIERHIRNGLLPNRKLGKSYCFTRNEIEAYCNAYVRIKVA